MGKKKLIIVKDDKTQKTTIQQKGKWNDGEMADVFLGALQRVIAEIGLQGIPTGPIVEIATKEMNKNFNVKEQTNE